MKNIITITLLFLCHAVSASDVPRVSQSDRGLLLALPEQILRDETILKQLRSGLTSTFAVQLKGRDTNGVRHEGGSLIEVRYELWDEHYIIHVIDRTGGRQRHTVPNRQALVQWWNGLKLNVLAQTPDRLDDVRVSVEFIPFSVGEQSNAQRWVSRTLGEQGNAAGDRFDRDGQSAVNRSVFNSIMATSIKRKPLYTFSWKVAVN